MEFDKDDNMEKKHKWAKLYSEREKEIFPHALIGC